MAATSTLTAGLMAAARTCAATPRHAAVSHAIPSNAKPYGVVSVDRWFTTARRPLEASP